MKDQDHLQQIIGSKRCQSYSVRILKNLLWGNLENATTIYDFVYHTQNVNLFCQTFVTSVITLHYDNVVISRE